MIFRRIFWIKILILSGIILASAPAFSKLLIEPYGGINILGKIKQKPNYKWEYDGLIYGGRLGWTFSRFMLGAQYERSSFEQVQTAPDAVTAEADLKLNQDATYYGAFIGFKYPFKLKIRVWATYFLEGQFIQDGESGTGDTYSGSGYAAGLGYIGLWPFALNMEYRMLTFNKFEDISAGTETTLGNKREVAEIVFTVSIPIVI